MQATLNDRRVGGPPLRKPLSRQRRQSDQRYD